MRPLTLRQAALVAAAVAFFVYLPSLANEWSSDDPLVIEANDHAHSAGAAVRAWFDTYGQPPIRHGGLYRPLTILSYGIDWSVSNGAVWWFHWNNVLLHALVTAMVVLVLGMWMRPTACLVAGLIFAVHPVHVEAVANVVGRAELLVSVGILGAVLSARRYRQEQSVNRRRVWCVVTIGAVALALHAKESAIIAPALILLDHVLDSGRDRRVHGELYLGLAVVVIAWYHVWNGIAGEYVGSGAHGAWLGTTVGVRAATMFPAYLDLLRLLVVPIDLASDYSPQVVPIRTGWSWLATLGLASTSAFCAIGLLTVRRAPAVAFGIILTMMSYAPVANLLFPSGVILSERGLYLGIVAPAVVGGLLVTQAVERGKPRLGMSAAVAVLAAFALVTIDRIPFWKDELNPVLEERAAHPENYRNRYLLSEYLSFTGDTTRALSEMLLAAELYPDDPVTHVQASRLALAAGRPTLAVRKALTALEILPTWGRGQELLATALIQADLPDSARAAATDFIHLAPAAGQTAETLVYVMEQTDAAAWQQNLARARRYWLASDLVRARAVLDSTAALLPDRVVTRTECRLLEAMMPMAQSMKQDLAAQIELTIASSPACRSGA